MCWDTYSSSQSSCGQEVKRHLCCLPDTLENAHILLQRKDGFLQTSEFPPPPTNQSPCLAHMPENFNAENLFQCGQNQGAGSLHSHLIVEDSLPFGFP